MATEEEYIGAVQAEQQAMAQQQAMENANAALGTASKLKPEQIQGVMSAIGGKQG
jgi:hypothetical protein